MPFEIGQRVGDYEVVQLLGAGGMGHVYRVRNIISNRTEAMKVLLPDLTAERDLAMRFISEIRTLASFDHPNIALLHTALQADNQLIMMMEFVEGYTLEQMAGQRALPIPEVVGYLYQALSALAYAHERGVVHRDIKPANLMVTSHGVLKLMDFGISKSNVENMNYTRPGTTIGSIYYMSPEQVRGGNVDARSDLYSMGVVLYELLAGRRPFQADSTFSILNAQLNTAPQPPMEVNPAVPEPMNAIVLKALAKDPAERFQNAEEFRTALRPFISSPSESAAAAPATVAQAMDLPPAQPLAATQAMAPQQPAAAYQNQAAAPPWQGQAVPPQPAPAYGNQPAAPPWQGQAARPVRPQRSRRAAWMTAGAVAAVLALVVAAIALPMVLRRTRAASTTTVTAPATDTTPPSADVTAPATTVPTTPAPGTEALPASTSGIAAPATGRQDRAAQLPVSTPRDNSGRAPGGQAPAKVSGVNDRTAGAGNSGDGSAAPAPATTPASSAELEQAQERMTQVGARASAAKRSVGIMRSQQQADGLGMRGDVESAESRMDSYLSSANSALARGDGAAAQRALDKADVEVTKLEKFLGH